MGHMRTSGGRISISDHSMVVINSYK